MSPGFPQIRRRLAAEGIPYFQWTPRVTNQRDYDRCVDIVNRLIADHQGDVLRAVLLGDISTGELLDADRRQELTGTKILSKVQLGRDLWKAIEETLPAMGKSEGGRKAYQWSFVALKNQRVVPWPKTSMTVRDLLDPKLDWNAMAEKWPKSAADWNNVVRAVRAFLTKYLGSVRHEFREQFGAAASLLPEDERVPDNSPELFGIILGHLPAHAKAVAMGLFLTGLRDRSEFFRADETHLMPVTCGVKIPARVRARMTKTKKGRVIYIDPDMWPWIVASIPAPIGYLQFLRYWRKACVLAGAGQYVETGRMKEVRVKLERGQVYSRKGHRETGQPEQKIETKKVPQLRYEGLRPHDLRHALAQWTHDDGIPLDKIKDVLGHSNISMSGRYARQANARDVATSAGNITRTRILK